MKKTIRYWLAFILSPIIPTIITYSVVVYLDFFEGLKIAWYTSHVFFIPFDLYYPLENDVWLDFLSFLVALKFSYLVMIFTWLPYYHYFIKINQYTLKNISKRYLCVIGPTLFLINLMSYQGKVLPALGATLFLLILLFMGIYIYWKINPS